MKPWPFLIVGLLLGLVAGLFYTWQLAPVEYYDTYPPEMHPYYREDWIRMTALSYGVEGDWERARLRLQDLPVAEIQSVVTVTLDNLIAAGRPIRILQRVAQMARDYGLESPAVRTYASAGDTLFVTPAVPDVAYATFTPSPAPPRPTYTPTPTPSPTPPSFDVLPTPVLPPPPYAVLTETVTCDPEPFISVALVVSETVRVRGRNRSVLAGLPGEDLWLLWDEGADRAVTGLRPDRGLGYADFGVVPERLYRLYVGTPTGAPVATLSITPCSNDAGGTGWWSWALTVEALDGGRGTR